MTHYIKFIDETTAINALHTADFVAEGQIITASHAHAIDVVGEIVRDDEILPGWHVNFMGELPENWEPYIFTPEHPVRLFAQ